MPPAYHDHNWGVWRDVTWEWGAARGGRPACSTAGCYSGSRAAVSPFFLTLVDSLGVRQVLRFDSIEYEAPSPPRGSWRLAPRASACSRRVADTVRLDVRSRDALASGMDLGGMPRAFLQMRGRFTLLGRVDGKVVADTGRGFFETYVKR